MTLPPGLRNPNQRFWLMVVAVLLAPLVPPAGRWVLGAWIVLVPGLGLSRLLRTAAADGAVRLVQIVTLSLVSLIVVAVLCDPLGIRLSAWTFAIGADVIGVGAFLMATALQRSSQIVEIDPPATAAVVEGHA